MLAIQVQFFHAVEFPPLDKAVEGNLERFFLRIPRGVSPQPEADRIDRFIDPRIVEMDLRVKLAVAVDMGVDPAQVRCIDCNIDAANGGIGIEFPAIVGLCCKADRRKRNEKQEG